MVPRDPVAFYNASAGIGRRAPESETLRTLSRFWQTDPSIVGTVLKAGLPDVERGIAGTVNRQPVLLTAAGIPWQASWRLECTPRALQA
jgi:hypothetical protein